MPPSSLHKGEQSKKPSNPANDCADKERGKGRTKAEGTEESTAPDKEVTEKRWGMHNQGWCSGRRRVPERRTHAGCGQPASALRRPGQPASYLLGEFLLEYQRGAQVAGAAHEQLVGAALQEGDRCADGAQSPELAEGLHVVGAAQGVVHERGHRVHARAPEQEGGAGVGVRLAPLFGAGARVDEALGGAQVALAGPGEKRALRDVVEHVGHPGHAAV